MAKKLKTPDDDSDYHRALYDLQVELVKLQRQLIADGERVLVIVEGRDTADNGETVVALLGDEATVKKFYRESGGQIRLQPANSAMQPSMVR